jgi:FSR family fosmidomycin resistance protein-like MFS transporter
MSRSAQPSTTTFALSIVGGISVVHLLNDLLQSLIVAIYPLFKSDFLLTFADLGLLTFSYQMAGSFVQPLIGWLIDRYPQPYALLASMLVLLMGLVLIAYSTHFYHLVLAIALTGMGSAIFHPEASRLTRMASGGQYGLAQSLFQLGGNFGAALGPLAALLIIPRGRPTILWFIIGILMAISILLPISRWFKQPTQQLANLSHCGRHDPAFNWSKVAWPLGLLLLIIFIKYIHLFSFYSYYIFYLTNRFQLSIPAAQLKFFFFLLSVAIGTLIGGPLVERLGRRIVIVGSMLGIIPFALLLPYANLVWTLPLTILIGVILASAFSAILVAAQELIPGRVGMVSGLFFGFAAGMGGVVVALLGQLADKTSIHWVYHCCSYLTLLGLTALLLPKQRDTLQLIQAESEPDKLSITNACNR